VPRLLLVEPGATPPETWETDEDWIRIPADPVDLHQRAEALRRRCAPEPAIHIDEHGLLWRGDAWAALSPVELAVLAALLDRVGRLVRRGELEQAAWPGERPDPRVLDRAITRCRVKSTPLGLGIHRIPGVGYLLDAAPSGGLTHHLGVTHQGAGRSHSRPRNIRETTDPYLAWVRPTGGNEMTARSTNRHTGGAR